MTIDRLEDVHACVTLARREEDIVVLTPKHPKLLDHASGYSQYIIQRSEGVDLETSCVASVEPGSGETWITLLPDAPTATIRDDVKSVEVDREAFALYWAARSIQCCIRKMESLSPQERQQELDNVGDIYNISASSYAEWKVQAESDKKQLIQRTINVDGRIIQLLQ